MPLLDIFLSDDAVEGRTNFRLVDVDVDRVELRLKGGGLLLSGALSGKVLIVLEQIGIGGIDGGSSGIFCGKRVVELRFVSVIGLNGDRARLKQRAISSLVLGGKVGGGRRLIELSLSRAELSLMKLRLLHVPIDPRDQLSFFNVIAFASAMPHSNGTSDFASDVCQ